MIRATLLRALPGSALCLLATGTPAQSPLQFRDVTAASGVQFTHQASRDTMSGGLCFFDFDNDGADDLFVTSRQGQNRLYRNRGNGTFTDVTLTAGVGARKSSMGAYAADLDNDGWLDLLVVTLGPNLLYRNNGDGTFTEMAQQAGLTEGYWSTAASFGDYDGDGLLDIYVGNYVYDGFFPYFDGAPNQLYRNEGGFRFTEVGQAAGVTGFKTFQDPRGFQRSTHATTLSVLMWDYDRDDLVDVLVGNDFGPFIIPDLLYRNNGDGTFTEVGASAGFAIAEFNMGLAVADVNGDRIPDLYTTNLGDNHLLLNDGRGRLNDVTRAWGAEEGTSNGLLLTSWACTFLDADLDARPDLHVSNGYIQTVPAMANDPDAPSRLLHNTGRSFRLAPSAEFPWGTGVGRGAGAADWDRDGDEDLAQLDNGDPLILYRNETATGNRSVILDLRGTLSNRDAVGATLDVRSRMGTQVIDVTCGGSYISCRSRTLVVGLASDDRVDRLEVEWPSGVRSTMLALESMQRHQVVEPSVTVRSIGSVRPFGSSFVEVPVTVRNHASGSESVVFAAGVSLGSQRVRLPAYHWPLTLAAGAETTTNVYVPIPPEMLPAAAALGVWMQIEAHSRPGAHDADEIPLR